MRTHGKIRLAAAAPVLLLLAAACLGAAPNAPGPGFPVSTPEAQGMDSERIVRMIRYILDNRLAIHNLLIIRNGSLVTEAAFYPSRKDARHVVNSCTKSVTSALVGIALGEGLIGDVNDPVLGYFPERTIAAVDARKRALTIRNLLMMTAGMEWTEDGNYGSPSDSWRLLWDSPDQVGYVLDRPMKEVPGTAFYYNTGASHVLSAIIQKATGKTALEFAREKLFSALGIADVTWDADTNGVTVGGAGLYLRPVDLAKFGLLYLNRGKWGDRQIVPEEWVDESTSRLIATPYGLAGRYGYGYQWWMNDFGGYSARGYGGQYLFVLPRRGLVAVFTSGLPNEKYFAPESLMQYFVVPSMTSDAPLPANAAMNAELRALLSEIAAPPAAKAPEAVPDAARRVSGSRFVLPDGASLSFVFDGRDECTWIVTREGSRFEARVGLDGVARISDVGSWGRFPEHNLVACTGSWSGDDTLVLRFRALEGCDELEYYWAFGETRISYRVFSRMGGTLVEQGTASRGD